MEMQIGEIAGAIWHVLDVNGELTLPALRKKLGTKEPVVDWALGWLAREDKIELAHDKKSILVRLKGMRIQKADAA